MASAVFVMVQPATVGAGESPKPGRVGMTRWKLSVRCSTILRYSTPELGQPWRRTSGMAWALFEGMWKACID